jgi:tetratricopeptide (TPR) repeat protein
MTNYGGWDKKAADLVKEADEEDKKTKEESDKALGLQDGPQGPPTAKAQERRADLKNHSGERKNFIAEQQAKEVVLTHSSPAEPVVISSEEAGGRALRISGSSDASYEIPEGVQLLKLFVDKCRNVRIHLRHHLVTSNVELYLCSDIEFRADKAVASVQCDECAEGPVRILFKEPEHIGTFYHQNSPALEVALDGQELSKIGVAKDQQFVSRPGSKQGTFVTTEMIRGEGDFPMNIGSAPELPAPHAGGAALPGAPRGEPEAEAPPVDEEVRQRAEAKRLEGNDLFRANDFLQAAVSYTQAIELCPDLHLAWANRAQCFLHTGQPEKALEDGTRCTELVPDYAKGWFRKGMALHALKRYGEAIPVLGQAEKLDPKNSQIPEAIKMAQMMCRKHGYDGNSP